MSDGAEDEIPTIISADDLMAHSALAGTEPFSIPGVGTVMIRGLSRDEALQIAETKGTRAREIKMVSWGMVEPAMTYQQVDIWFRQVQAGVIQKLSGRINQLSGLNEEAEKEAVERFRDDTE